MKLGSIVGMIIAGILIVAGIIMCIVGTISAKGDDRELFMQVDDSGTHYIQDISSDVTKLSIECDSSDITIKGGAERSFIEFNNFNPNRYSISATANVITFNETADISSLLDLGDFGFSFKGLRYFLDPRNDDFDDFKKSIIINIAADSSLKIIDITAQNSELLAEDITVSGDILLNIKNGSVTVNTSTANSAISITGETLKTSISGSKAKVLRFNANDAELSVNTSEFENTEIVTESGRVDFISDVTLDNRHISVTTGSGGILFNTKPVASPFNHEPTVGEDAEETVNSFKITSKSGSINIQFPSQIVINSTTPTVNTTP